VTHRLDVGVLDVVSTPVRTLWSRLMNANFASIMPQAVGAWCERAGHRVHYSCYTGIGDPLAELPDRLDLLFIGAFTHAAHFAYALSNLYRVRGTVTVLGGPHARCYPEDAARFFDYVLGFTDRAVIEEVLRECAPHRPLGRRLSAASQPAELPPLAERWKFVEAALSKAPAFKLVPMIASLGCPYDCCFCIDSTVEYRSLGLDQLREDLRFVLTRTPKPVVGWHDPIFGVRFDATMDAIEDAVPPGRIRHGAESSLSLLTEAHLVRLRRNGFQALLPGVESWYEMGDKSRTRLTGLEKVRHVSEQLNLILRYVPYVRTGFVLGLDSDHGAEPFELTKRFEELSPGVFPGFALLTAFGRAAPLNLEYQRAGRVLPFPFHFLDNHSAMNVRPKHYAWPAFLDHVLDLLRYSHSGPQVARRFAATRGIPRWIHLLSSVSSEGRGRIRYLTTVRRLLDEDSAMLRFMNAETDVLPAFYRGLARRELGPLYDLLPEGAMEHDHLAYLASTDSPSAARGGRGDECRPVSVM
jgi:hypothetical protein